MSIIAVKGIPFQWSLIRTEKFLTQVISGHFECLNFGESKGNMHQKTCYLRLSPKLDPVRILEKINTSYSPTGTRLSAYIPGQVPDIPLAPKTKRLPFTSEAKLRVDSEGTKPRPYRIKPEKLIREVSKELKFELRLKYKGFQELNRKHKGKLSEVVHIMITKRLRHVMLISTEKLDTYHALGRAYRRLHPQFGDFQFMMKAKNKSQDILGLPPERVDEREFTQPPTLKPIVHNNLPLDKIQQSYSKYSEKMTLALTEYIKSLKSGVSPADDDELVAKKKVRAELKNIAPYLPLYFKEVMTRHYNQDKTPMIKMRIFGEPELPPKDSLMSFLGKFHAVQMFQIHQLYNVMIFKIPYSQFSAIMAMDGTVINGQKLVIRRQQPNRMGEDDIFDSDDETDDKMDTSQDGGVQDDVHRPTDDRIDEDDEWTESWD